MQLSRTGRHSMRTLFSKPLYLSALVCALFATSGVGAVLARPGETMGQDIPLEQVVPNAFGDWKALSTGVEQTSLSVATDGTLSEEQPYGQVIMRTYENSRGERVMLALGYAKQQKQEVKIHRPEVCYMAQGFKVLGDQLVDLPQFKAHAGVPGRRLLMRNAERLEAVTYWIRVGGNYPRGGLNTRMAILQYGLQGRIPDAMLVRASSILANERETAHGFEQQEHFLADLVRAMPRRAATMLVAGEL
jgi:EpsI family protein